MVLLNPYFDLYQILKTQKVDLQLATRKKLIWAFSWAIPSTEAILALSEQGPILEVGAGSGYWAWLLRQAGANVIAVDHESGQPPHWSTVLTAEASVAAAAHPNRLLFFCWPPYSSSMAAEALRNFKGHRVAYIGEFDGRTGDSEFHQLLREGFRLEREVAIPSWPGFVDRLYFYVR